jgi:hypothetical protein
VSQDPDRHLGGLVRDLHEARGVLDRLGDRRIEVGGLRRGVFGGPPAAFRYPRAGRRAQPQAPDRGLARDGPTVVDAVGDRRGLARRGRVEDLALACPLVAVRRGRWLEDVSPRKRNRAGSEVVAWLEHDLCS